MSMTMVKMSMTMVMGIGTDFVGFIKVVYTKMKACTANSIITPCDTRRGCYFARTAKGASSNNGIAKCKVSHILQSGWLNSLEEC